MAGALPTASPPVMTPGGVGAHFNYEVWEPGADEATYQKLLFASRISQSKRPYSKVHGRKKARLEGNSMGAGDVGTGLLYQNPVGAEWTLTPAGNYVALAWSENEDAMTEIPLDSELAGDMESALAEQTDRTALANVVTLSQYRGSNAANAEVGMFRNALALVGRNTNGMIAVGETTIYGILDWSQYPHLMNIPEFMNAEIRGDSENPNVKGMWSKGGGVMMMLTTVCAEDPNGTHGCLWVPKAFAIGWNVRTRTKRQDLEFQNRLLLYNNVGTTVRHDLRAVSLRTGNEIPA